MNKEVIDSILLANSYFIACKIQSHTNCNCPKTDIARKYLFSKIQKALKDKKSKKANRFSLVSCINFFLN
jgi:hypothetical protein